MGSMEFWGIEVKPGEMVKCDPGTDKLLHLSQASLGEVKKDKGNEAVPIFVKVGDKKLVLGTLSPEKCTHISFDLIFEKEFELSHNWKHGSVYFCGYKTIAAFDDSEDFSGSESEEDILPVPRKENGSVAIKNEEGKSAAQNSKEAKSEPASSKAKVKIVEPNKDAKTKNEVESDDDEDDDESDDDEDDESDDEDEEMLGAGDRDSDDDDEDDDESSDDEDEETPKKDDKGKKRVMDSATKTPAPEKKAKLVTPIGGKKTGGDGKKGSHTATPHPSKQAGKAPLVDGKGKQQTPSSLGKKSNQVSCSSCSKTFGTAQALQAHTAAKHSGGK